MKTLSSDFSHLLFFYNMKKQYDNRDVAMASQKLKFGKHFILSVVCRVQKFNIIEGYNCQLNCTAIQVSAPQLEAGNGRGYHGLKLQGA